MAQVVITEERKTEFLKIVEELRKFAKDPSGYKADDEVIDDLRNWLYS